MGQSSPWRRPTPLPNPAVPSLRTLPKAALPNRDRSSAAAGYPFYLWVLACCASLFAGCVLVPLEDVNPDGSVVQEEQPSRSDTSDGGAQDGSEGGSTEDGAERDGASDAMVCAASCEPGALRCADGMAQQCTEMISGGPEAREVCGVWEGLESCADGCLDGVCCSHECDEGVTRCLDGAEQLCGNFDDDPCREWGPSEACEHGCGVNACIRCVALGEACGESSACCGNGEGEALCLEGQCRAPCEMDGDCDTCCIPVVEGQTYLGRGCAATAEDCDGRQWGTPVGLPCGGDYQCETGRCGPGGFCARECGGFGSRACGTGLIFDNACIGLVFPACYPTCDSDADCSAFPNTICQSALTTEASRVRVCSVVDD